MIGKKICWTLTRVSDIFQFEDLERSFTFVLIAEILLQVTWKMYIPSFHVLANDDQKLVHARSNLDIIDMFDHDIVDIYSENQKMMAVDMLNT